MRREELHAAIDAGDLLDNAPVTPCPAWCDEPAHANGHEGPNWEHTGARTDITEGLGCSLGQISETGEFYVYVSDGEHTLGQARQLAEGLLRAVEVAERAGGH